MKQLLVGLVAHVDAGKTTLAESLLFTSGAIRRQGRVDHGDTALDVHPLEKARGITIFASLAAFTAGNTRVTLLDTPGHVDFSAETERTLAVLDAAVLVISATDGVQAHTRTLWKLLARYGIPTLLFVTKDDIRRVPREDIVKEMQKVFGPVEAMNDGLSFADPEHAALADESLMTEYLDGGSISESAVAEAVQARRLFPCFFGSGLKNEGIAPLLSALDRLLPARTFPAAFSARAYKIVHEKNERVTFLRVTGGTLKIRDELSAEGKTEKITGLRVPEGARLVPAESVGAGEVCAVTGLSFSRAGQGFGREEDGHEAVLEPVLRYRLLLPEGCDARTLYPKLKSLEEEDPALHFTFDERSGDFHCSLMGRVQAEILQSLILDRFSLEIGVTGGRVIYKETVADTVEGVGHYEPLRHYAEVHLLIRPLPRGSGVVIDSTCPEDRLDRSWQRLIMTHLAEKTHLGVLTGSPLTDVRLTLCSGRAHQKHTEGGDFRQATYRAVRQGLMHAQNVLLEPWVRFRLELPCAQVGRAITDIRQKCGTFDPPENDGETAVLTGRAPMTELDGYQAELTAYTGGRGRLSLDPDGYDVCHDAEAVLSSFAYDADRDVDEPADSVFCAHGAGFTVKWNEVPNYMHLESVLAPRPKEAPKRCLSIDEKELEAILLREFGPVRTRLPRPAVNPSAPRENETRETAAPEKCLIVDGYNVIFAWPELRAIAEEDLDGARTQLCRMLSNFALYREMKAVVVFDGYRVHGSEGEKEAGPGLSVAYTKENETADAYIERMVYEIGRNEQVRVVTGDGLIRLSVLSHGVTCASCEDLAREIEIADQEIGELMEKQASSKEKK